MLGIISYILAVMCVYNFWEPEGFLGLIGALFVSTFLSVPIYFVMMLALVAFGMIVGTKKP